MEKAVLKTLDWGQSVSRKIVSKIFQRMTLGLLRVDLPNGESLLFGDQSISNPVAMKIHDEAFFRQLVLFADIGLGESYVKGIWDTDDLAGVISFFIRNRQNLSTVSGGGKFVDPVNILESANRLKHLFRKNSKRMARENIHDHYDLSNHFFALMLDKTMTYSSAFFATKDEELESAQLRKYQKLASKLQLCKDDHILEIGSGWGGFAIFAAQNYCAKVTSITLSQEQLSLAQKRVEDLGLQDQITFLFKDYRDMQGQFSKIVSIEMIEAVGDEYLETYFNKINSLLAPNGLVAIQAITSPDCRYREFAEGVDWIQKHIFPGSLLPSIGAMVERFNKSTDLQIFHLEDFGPHYAETLRRWGQNVSKNRAMIKKLGMDETFFRKWHYYLEYCEAGFDTRHISVVQMVLTRPNNELILGGI